MRTRLIFVIPAIALVIMGCSSMLFKKTPAPLHYQLTYSTKPVSCRASFRKGLRIWDFSGVNPYDQSQMVVEESDGKTLYSSEFQWVAEPGTLVAQGLLRDMSSSAVFPQVVGESAPGTYEMNLTGRVFQFVLKRSDEGARAVLQVAVSLSEKGTPPRVLLRKTYTFKSLALTNDDSAAFADAMSGLMSEFSERLREDLCAKASEYPSISRQSFEPDHVQIPDPRAG